MRKSAVQSALYDDYDLNGDGMADSATTRNFNGDVLRSVTRYEDYIAMTIAATL